MSVESQFARVAERMLGDGDEVEEGRMLRSTALKVGGKFFAFTTRGKLVVKLPAARVKELIAGGAGRECSPRKGRPMREWVCLRPADARSCAAYVLEARNFVAAQTTEATSFTHSRVAKHQKARDERRELARRPRHPSANQPREGRSHGR